MKNPLEITFHNMNHIDEIEEIIQEKFEKVKVISPDVTKCHIILEKLSRHHQSANKSSVRLDIKVPHINDIVVSEKCTEDANELKTTVLKVFKRGKTLLREEVAKRRDKARHPKPDDLLEPPDAEDEYEDNF